MLWVCVSVIPPCLCRGSLLSLGTGGVWSWSLSVWGWMWCVLVTLFRCMKVVVEGRVSCCIISFVCRVSGVFSLCGCGPVELCLCCSPLCKSMCVDGPFLGTLPSLRVLSMFSLVFSMESCVSLGKFLRAQRSAISSTLSQSSVSSPTISITVNVFWSHPDNVLLK